MKGVSCKVVARGSSIWRVSLLLSMILSNIVDPIWQFMAANVGTCSIGKKFFVSFCLRDIDFLELIKGGKVPIPLVVVTIFNIIFCIEVILKQCSFPSPCVICTVSEMHFSLSLLLFPLAVAGANLVLSNVRVLSLTLLILAYRNVRW